MPTDDLLVSIKQSEHKFYEIKDSIEVNHKQDLYLKKRVLKQDYKAFLPPLIRYSNIHRSYNEVDLMKLEKIEALINDDREIPMLPSRLVATSF